jgi:hypothetical protein
LELAVIFIVPSALIAEPQFVVPTAVPYQDEPESEDVYMQDSSRTPAIHETPSLLAANELKLGP